MSSPLRGSLEMTKAEGGSAFTAPERRRQGFPGPDPSSGRATGCPPRPRPRRTPSAGAKPLAASQGLGQGRTSCPFVPGVRRRLLAPAWEGGCPRRVPTFTHAQAAPFPAFFSPGRARPGQVGRRVAGPTDGSWRGRWQCGVRARRRSPSRELPHAGPGLWGGEGPGSFPLLPHGRTRGLGLGGLSLPVSIPACSVSDPCERVHACACVHACAHRCVPASAQARPSLCGRLPLRAAGAATLGRSCVSFSPPLSPFLWL